MPIRISHTPVGALLGLAQAAGERQRQEQGAAADLAFTQMAMQTATRNAEIAARMQAQDRAFDLQEAAAERRERTMTARQQVRSPIGDSVLTRMQWKEGVEQQKTQAQMQQLETMRGSMSPEEYDRAKLRVMGGGRLSTFKEETPGISTGQQLMLTRQRYERERRPYEDSRRDLSQYVVASKDKDARARYQAQLDKVTQTLADIEQRQRAEEATIGGGGAVMDPVTREVSTDEAGGAVSPADTLAGQPSVAVQKKALAQARLYLLGQGQRNPSNDDVVRLAEILLLNQQSR